MKNLFYKHSWNQKAKILEDQREQPQPKTPTEAHYNVEKQQFVGLYFKKMDNNNICVPIYYFYNLFVVAR